METRILTTKWETFIGKSATSNDKNRYESVHENTKNLTHKKTIVVFKVKLVRE